MFNELNFSRQIESEKSEEEQPCKTVVVLGGGFKKNSKGNRLGITTKMRVLAVGELFSQGLVDRIIFSGGRTAGEDNPSEAEAMKSFLLRKFPEIPQDSILLEDCSENTVENAQNTLKLMEEKGIKRAMLLTSATHLPRAMMLFRNFGVDVVKGIAAEDEFGKRSKHHKRLIEKIKRSRRIKREKIKELILRGILFIDRKGRIVGNLKEKSKNN